MNSLFHRPCGGYNKINENHKKTHKISRKQYKHFRINNKMKIIKNISKLEKIKKIKKTADCG